VKFLQRSVVREFAGIYDDEAEVASAPLLHKLIDQERRPEITSTQFFECGYIVVPTGSNVTGPTYPLWNTHLANWTTEDVFIAIETSAVLKITGETPTGVGTWILTPTNSSVLGVHKAQFQFVGKIESLTLQIPSTANGGIAGEFKMSAFLMPALEPTYAIGLT